MALFAHGSRPTTCAIACRGAIGVGGSIIGLRCVAVADEAAWPRARSMKRIYSSGRSCPRLNDVVPEVLRKSFGGYDGSLRDPEEPSRLHPSSAWAILKEHV